MKQLFFLRTMLVIGACVALGLPAVAARQGLPTGFSETSEYTINYDDWNLILSAAVLDVGPSDRRPAGRNGTRSATTKIKHGNTNKTAFEGNRVIFSEFGDAHIDNLLGIRRDLEAVVDFIPLESFTRNQQLAYWYNLHNVAVMLEVAKEYPIKKIKPLAVGKRSVWDKKTMSIGGVPTSIQDIEDHVVANWNSPLVLYGFFMGTVGGPNIRTEAFTGENVVQSLQANAIEFINSLRGFRLWSGRGRVSDHYKLGARFFPNFEDDIKDHMLTFSRPDTRKDLEKAKSMEIKNYDWGIADLKNGDTYNGSSFNTNPGALAFFIEAPNPQGASPFGGAAPAAVAALDNLGNDPSVAGARSAKISPQTQALLRAMKIRNERRRSEGIVTVEEFIENEGSRVSKKEPEKKE